MSDSKTFNGVSTSTWECVKETSLKEHGTIYAPPGANKGTAKTSTIVGDVVLDFDFDPTKESVAYTIVKKPVLAPKSQIWSGIQDTINGCSGN
ncbi:hypothetical protein [uncultured Aquimarina sp.]|uniref:hypothetical protein n=1 Tax=uncultured Aquimarina sp. TaxID=575652 RepID=UPI00260A12A5|nr:hypothetical protein [uncultured Aquimarina sp.]